MDLLARVGVHVLIMASCYNLLRNVDVTCVQILVTENVTEILVTENRGHTGMDERGCSFDYLR